MMDMTNAIKKVQQNPVSVYDGGYGKPLGNKGGSNLAGFYKVKLRDAGLHIVAYSNQNVYVGGCDWR